METASIFEAMAPRRKVKQDQRAWKYIRDLCDLSVDDLNKTAIIDGNKEYTYGLMFREWERYASVFSALDMTEEQHARVGVMGSTCIETIFTFYGLNMVGAEISMVASWTAFNFTRIKETIIQEKLTDFILTDDLAQQDLVRDLLLKREELGLRHIIILHVPIAGPTAIPMLMAAQEAKHASMKALYRPICMETLLAAYGNHPVHYASQELSETAIILHTTGTTSGVGKPVPLSDSAFNAAVASFMSLKGFSLPYDHLVTSIMLDLANSYAIIDQVHLPFAMGGTVIVIPFGLLNPWFYKAIATYRISFLFTVNSMVERWMKLPEGTKFDFSSLEFVAFGGTAVSAAEKKRYHDFFEAHGGKDVTILNGYGLSELGGACCLSTPDLDDESIGYPMPGINIRLCDDETGRFFSPPKGKVSEGVLYMNAKSMASQKLDGEDVIKMEVISGKPYVCTNDTVRVTEDGRITYLGRANRFFVRDEGRKYESGRVETGFSRLAYIENCGIVPVFHKQNHESVPMLCVKTLDDAGEPKDVILRALRQVFVDEKTLPEDHLPSLVMLAETLPLNINGKVDLFKLNRGEVAGEKYLVEAVYENGQLSNFELTFFEEGPADVVQQVIDDISADIQNTMPSNKIMEILNGDSSIIGDRNEAFFESFGAMNQMHQQTINNVASMMGQMFPFLNQFKPLQASEMASMRSMMPDIEGMMPEMQQMVQDMQEMVMDAPIVMKGIAQAVLPIFHQQHTQMLSNMNKMNQMAFETTKRFHEQNAAMAEKWFNMAMGMAGREPGEEEEAE